LGWRPPIFAFLSQFSAILKLFFSRNFYFSHFLKKSRDKNRQQKTCKLGIMKLFFSPFFSSFFVFSIYTFFWRSAFQVGDRFQGGTKRLNKFVVDLPTNLREKEMSASEDSDEDDVSVGALGVTSPASPRGSVSMDAQGVLLSPSSTLGQLHMIQDAKDKELIDTPMANAAKLSVMGAAFGPTFNTHFKKAGRGKQRAEPRKATEKSEVSDRVHIMLSSACSTNPPCP